MSDKDFVRDLLEDLAGAEKQADGSYLIHLNELNHIGLPADKSNVVPRELNTIFDVRFMYKNKMILSGAYPNEQNNTQLRGLCELVNYNLQQRTATVKPLEKNLAKELIQYATISPDGTSLLLPDNTTCSVRPVE